MKRHTVAWSVASLAVCLVAAAGAVYAQNAPEPPTQAGAGPGFGPAGMGRFQRPAFTPTRVQGTVARAIVGPLGRVQGLLLDTGTVVMLGHHRGHGPHGDPSADPAANTTSPVPVGTAVVVDGFTTAASANTVYRATVYDRAGTTVLVQPPPRPAWAGQGGPSGAPSGAPEGGPGPWHHRGGGGPGGHHGFGGHRGQMFHAMAQLPARSASGVIRAVLTGPHGEAHGVVLHDGTSVFLGPGLAHQLPAGSLAVGQALRAEGQGNQYPAGGSMFARQVTLASGSVFSAPARPAPSGTATP